MRTPAMAGLAALICLGAGPDPLLAGSSPPPPEGEAVCAGSAPGEVLELVVESYNPATGEMQLSYQPACGAVDHHLEFGPLEQVSTLAYSGQQCGLGTSGTVASFQPGAGSFFFLMVSSDGAGQEGSYGTMQTGGVFTQRPADPIQASCSFVQNLAAACDAPPPAITLDMTAYRPQTAAYGAPFQRTPVPPGELLSPGVGVRVNGDDDDGNATPDRDHGAVAGENDLVELVLEADPPCANGVDYVLRRSGPTLQVWADSSKQVPLLVQQDEAVLTFSGSTRTVWVESVGSGQGDVELLALDGDGGQVAGLGAHFYSFSSVVVALGGEGQVAADPPLEPSNHGTFQIALQLYSMGYDVHMYDEDVVQADGSGAAYDEVVQAVQNREVTGVAIFGYSHGGGSTNDLADLLDANRGAIGAFSILYTAYIDGIDNRSDIDIATETALPPSTLYHANYYENPGCGLFTLCGGPISGADINLDVNTTPWGASLDHFQVDDAPEVTGAIRDHVLAMVPR